MGQDGDPGPACPPAPRCLPLGTSVSAVPGIPASHKRSRSHFHALGTGTALTWLLTPTSPLPSQRKHEIRGKSGTVHAVRVGDLPGDLSLWFTGLGSLGRQHRARVWGVLSVRPDRGVHSNRTASGRARPLFPARQLVICVGFPPGPFFGPPAPRPGNCSHPIGGGCRDDRTGTFPAVLLTSWLWVWFRCSHRGRSGRGPDHPEAQFVTTSRSQPRWR